MSPSPVLPLKINCEVTGNVSKLRPPSEASRGKAPKPWVEKIRPAWGSLNSLLDSLPTR